MKRVGWRTAQEAGRPWPLGADPMVLGGRGAGGGQRSREPTFLPSVLPMICLLRIRH